MSPSRRQEPLCGNLTCDVDVLEPPSGADVARPRVASTGRRRNGESGGQDELLHRGGLRITGTGLRRDLGKDSRVVVDAELDWREGIDQQNNRREAVPRTARQVVFEGAACNRPN